MAKVKKKAKKPQNQENNSNTGKNGFLFSLTALLVALALIVMVVTAVFFIVIKNNVNGLAERYRKDIEKIPILNLALPKIPDPEDPNEMTDEQVRKKYVELRELKDNLAAQLEASNKQIEELLKYKEEQEKKAALNEQAKLDIEKREAQLAAANKKLQEDRQKLGEQAVNINPAGFKEYFAELDPETAQKLYSQIVREEMVNEEVQAFLKTYEAVDPGATAQIFNEMGVEKIDLIVDILKGMKKAVSAEVLAEMDVSLAAKVTEKMAEISKQAGNSPAN